MPKAALVVSPKQLEHVFAVEVAMDLYAFSIAKNVGSLQAGGEGVILVRTSGDALPWYRDGHFYDIYDLESGVPFPNQRPVSFRSTLTPIATMSQLIIALRKAAIVSTYLGTAGAFPLIGTDKLKAATVFYRCLSAPKDNCILSNGKLRKGTYLTTELECSYANSGFAVVGRYALPLPIPASFLFQYELPAKTKLKVGTVTPLFGQAGGGVEVQLVDDTLPVRLGDLKLHDY